MAGGMNKRSLNLVIIFCGLWCCLVAGVLAQPVIKQIEIRGIERVKLEEVQSLISVKEGEELSPQKYNEDITRLYRSGKFSRVQVLQETLAEGIKLVYEVQENPIIESINIYGHQQFDTEQIRKALPLKEKDFLPLNFAELIKTSIIRLYAEKKKYETEVTVNALPGQEKNTVVVSIYINEKLKLLIKDLHFRGNKSFSGARLRLLVTNHGSWWLYKKYYDEEAFAEDLIKIQDFYVQHGFLDVVIKRGIPEYNQAENWISPVIEIQEGPRYKISEIEPKGNVVFRNDEIIKIFHHLIGGYYSGKHLAKALQKLGDMYGDEGYIQTEVRVEKIKQTETTSVKIILWIDEKTRVYVGNVKVESVVYEEPEKQSWFERLYSRVSPPVKDEVITRELLLKPGDVYRQYKEQRSEDRLKHLGIFDEVKITREPTEKPDTMNMLVSVKPAAYTGGLGGGVGYGDATGAFVFAQYRERNLFGEARNLDASILYGQKVFGLRLSYLDRHFRETNNSLRLEFYRDLFQRRGYDEITLGGQAEYGIQSSNELVRHYVRLRLEQVSFKDIDEDIEMKLDDYPVATVRYRMVYDSRDDLSWPTRGELKSAGIELGHADGFLAKATGAYAGYWRIYRDLILALDIFGGFMPYDADKVGITERFFLGGTNDLRGFKYRGAGPYDKGDNKVPTGGATKLVARNELRFPIYEKLRGLVFMDVGTIDEEFSIGKPRASAGLGFRYDLKVVYISVDFAHAFIKQRKDRTTFFHFSIGSLF